MKILKYLRILTLAINFIAFFIIVTLVSAFAGSAEMTVTNVTRISHPAYQMQNHWSGERNPWNKDYTRIMMYESTWTHPDYPEATNGRYLVWGFIDDLKRASGGTVAQYKSAARQVFSKQGNWSSWAEWSIFDGEESYIYGLYKPAKKVAKVNVDTGEMTYIISYDPGDGTDISRAKIIGWTSNDKLVLIFNGSNNTKMWTEGGYEIDVQAFSRTRYSSWPSFCTADNYRFPYGPSAIHGDVSLDRKYRAQYNASTSESGVYINDFNDANCTKSGIKNYIDINNTDKLTHISWGANNDWYVGANMGNYFFGHKNTDTPPYLSTVKINMVTFNRDDKTFTHNNLITTTTTGYRKTSLGDGDHNYIGGIPSSTLRDDGLQIMYVATDGKYSKEDVEWCDKFRDSVCTSVNNNYEGLGVFLADLALKSGGGSDPNPASDTIPSPPTGLKFQ